jgi:aspartate 1-decarboxylase
VHVGDVVIVIAYGMFDAAEASAFRPRIVHVDAANSIIEIDSDAASAIIAGVKRPPLAL